MKKYKINNNVTNDENDWRFTGQDEYLKSVTLHHKKYRQHSESWNHEHCDFCFATFSIYDNDLHEGYCTEDENHWICEECFNDFKKMFDWNVIIKEE